MIRFIDLTEQYWIDSVFKTRVFAFLDTTNDTFLTINGNQTWGYVEDLVDDVARDKSIHNEKISRLFGLIPKGYTK